MEPALLSNEKRSMISSFLEITVGQTAETAMQFLQVSNWNLAYAIQLFNNDDEDEDNMEDDDQVRPPRPVKKDTLYKYYPQDDHSPEVWESEHDDDNNLVSLYRPPVDLMFNGSFEKAKEVASDEDKWLLVNLQSTKEFISHMLNRDTWANEAVSQTISANNFIFWQVYDDTNEGMKVCSYYNLDSIPVVLVIDPITGQKMRHWCGMVDPESLLEDLLVFMDSGPRDQLAVATAKIPAYPPIPEEPLQVDRKLVCRIGVRLPDGSRIRRNFLHTDLVQLLWSFCYSQLERADQRRRFLLTQAIPGASKILDYNTTMTFQESGLDNSMLTVTWE